MPRRLTRILAGGALYAFAFPSLLWTDWAAWQTALAWAALVPLLVEIARAPRWRQAALAGWGFGAASWLLLLYWIAGMEELGALAVPAWLAFAALLGLWGAAFGAGAHFLLRPPSPLAPALLGLPSLWAGLEFLRAHLLTGFPWALLGSSQLLNAPLLQWASVAGVYGVSWIVAFGATAAALAALGRLGRSGAVAALGGLAALHAAGAWLGRSWTPEALAARHPAVVRVALLQGNVPQDEKWSPEHLTTTLDRYAALLRNVPPAAMVVWPETAVPGLVRLDPGLRQRVGALVRETRAHHLIGAPDAEVSAQGTLVAQANSAFWCDPSGTLAASYDKRHLVPFGEFTPFNWLKPLVARYTIGVAEFRRGGAPRTFEGGALRPAPLICYEAIFPHEARRALGEGADVLVNLTNDAWFGRSAALAQHAQAAALRAVETRRYLLRCANTGVTCVIHPSGRVAARLPPHAAGRLDAELHPAGGGSFYLRAGDLFAWSALAAAAVCLALAGRAALR